VCVQRMATTQSSRIPTERRVSPNFITDIIDADLQAGRYQSVITRFPPEPNGYPHIGHAKSICLNFGLALDYQGESNLRFDDTNPETEDLEFVQAMLRDIEWLGFKPTRVLYASDYFDFLHDCAVQLIRDGLAYVDSVNEDELRELRGTVTQAGRPSQYRDRTVEENLDLFARMRAGEFPTGAHVLRAKIDLTHPNMKLRDPVLYRIVHAEHYRKGNDWCIYPFYDFAHPLSDALEGITHSLCTLEFENNRDIYDWLVEALRGKVGLPAEPRPYQYEFARLNIDYTVLSKRKLLRLVNEGFVSGWDDPRMPTLSGFRRRGITPESIRDFVDRVGVSKANSRVELATLESAVRDDLNTRAPRVLAVLDPLKVVITDLPDGEVIELDAPYWPHDIPREGTRSLPFTREVFIERDDFAINPPKGFRRLVPGGLVRLRHAGVIRCDEVVQDPTGNVIELRCSRVPDATNVQGTIHWVSATRGLKAEFRLYDRLFIDPDPAGSDAPLEEQLNGRSLVTMTGYVEPSVAEDEPGSRYQFERLGFFWPDPVDSRPDRLVFNRIITLRDTFARETQAAKPQAAPKARKGEAATPTVAPTLTPEQAGVVASLTARGVNESEALVVAREPRLNEYLEAAAKAGDVATLARWVVNELAAPIKSGEARVTPAQLASLVALVQDGSITTRTARDVLAEAQASGTDPVAMVRDKGLRQVTDTAAIEAEIEKAIAGNPDKVAAYRSGRTGLIGFFAGQVMRATNGQANPQLVQELLARKLSG
jgi:glutaminyl-tRNA synthetase